MKRQKKKQGRGCDSFDKTYNRLKKHSKKGELGYRTINYVDAIEAMLERPFIRLYASGPETLNMLEKMNRIAIHGGLIVLLDEARKL